MDAAALGLGFEAYVFVSLSRPDVVEKFDEAVRAVSQVIEAQRQALKRLAVARDRRLQNIAALNNASCREQPLVASIKQFL
ncbi:MAG TPA: hypothetical protein VGC06_23450 [Actinomycetes bacterium]